ncbi:MAG: DUF4125 family protein [Desulfovibrio sp.]|uniref:DUF4125 family protein n=1 Tax=Desulfovibrio sp. TaxID=885 RepID=UPI00135F09DA|nr:DUF4125 family protein [Desulfovibrio sp.]MTJ91776.1 DUF4125 family protein [Desulfovibrio sp.]
MNTCNTWQKEIQDALNLLASNRAEDSAAKLRTVLRSCDNDPHCCALALDGLGRALLALKRPLEACQTMEQALAAARGAFGNNSILTLGILQNLAHVQLESGKAGQSEILGREAASLCEAVYGANSPHVAEALLHLSAACYRQQKLADAQHCLQRAVQIWQAQPEPSPRLGTCLNNLGRIEEERGNHAQGIALHRKAVVLRRSLLGECHEDTAFSLGNLGVALAASGQWHEAADVLESALACYARLGRHKSPEADGYRKNLVVCRKALGQQSPLRTGKTTHNAPSRATLLHEIIEKELVMFLATPNQGGTASCQQNPQGFRIMRRMSLTPLSDATLAHYLDDLHRAEAQGRNFMIEKYARMDSLIPPLQASPLVDEIVRAETAFIQTASAQYPHVIRHGGNSAFQNYLRCEAETYSPATLESYSADLRRARQQGRNPAIERFRCLADLLGKPSLEAFEQEARAL